MTYVFELKGLYVVKKIKGENHRDEAIEVAKEVMKEHGCTKVRYYPALEQDARMLELQ